MSEQGPTEPHQPDPPYVHREIDAISERVDRQDTRSENRYNLLTTLIHQFRGEFTAAISELRSDFNAAISELRTEFNTAINQLKTEFNTAISQLRSEFTAVVNKLSERIDKLEVRVSRIEKILLLIVFLLVLVLVLILGEGEIGQAIKLLASALFQLAR